MTTIYLPNEVNQLIIKYTKYSVKLLNSIWSDDDLIDFYKNYELDMEYLELKSATLESQDHIKFKKLSNVNNVNYIHDGLHTVTFGWRFNQPVVLPNSLRAIEFGRCFNRPIALPNTLHTITFNKNNLEKVGNQLISKN